MSAPAPSGGPPQTDIASAQADILFNAFSSLALQATYTHGTETATVWFLISPMPLFLTNGMGYFQPGDEQILIRAADLAGLSGLTNGDTLVTTVGGVSRWVVAIPQLDPTRQMYTMQTRKT